MFSYGVIHMENMRYIRYMKVTKKVPGRIFSMIKDLLFTPLAVQSCKLERFSKFYYMVKENNGGTPGQKNLKDQFISIIDKQC